MSKTSKTIENIYQKKTQREHVLLRPDSYVGSIEPVTKEMWVWDAQQERIVQKTITYVPGLFKVFDEIIVNAADNYQRDKRMTKIKVTIDSKHNRITVWNNGKGIPIVMHQKEKVYVPELVFGHMLTSSNYDDSVKKVTGGRNGFGAKLTNIFSKMFKITTADSRNRKKFTQTFKNNLQEIGEPKIESYAADADDFTEVVFEPDLRRFRIQSGGIDEDIKSLLEKRVIDLAGVTPPSVSVFLNNKKINKVKSFQSYVDLYFKDSCSTMESASDTKVFKVYESVGTRWEVCVAQSNSGQFQQVSFVNSINTLRGGSHVELVANQIVDRLIASIAKKHKKLEVKKPQVRQNLWVFVNAQIENPAFDSQTKETLMTNQRSFGSKCELSESFLKKVASSCILESVVISVEARQNAQLKRALGTGGKKKRQLFGIPKLDDANLAGTGHGSSCTLILTEGDSAKALAMAGLQIVGRDRYGVFPLKGKLLNVRDCSQNMILNNQELQNLIKIMGLFMGRIYNDVRDLRYGSIMIMTDQDHDGSHIKGLLINLLHHYWPSLLSIPGFLKEFITPIIKVSKNSKSKSFFTIADYERWVEKFGLQGSKVKYYKGLGTSTAAEAKEYFRDIDNHVIRFKTLFKPQDDEAINLAFSKNCADARKEWLTTYDRLKCIDHSLRTLGFTDFINYELIHFSIADNYRSIPSLIDGLKPGQRKIIFSCFKRLPSGAKKLSQEIKVAQLAGYVAEHSAYHHGEISLNMTIVGMAQDYVGSNNVNLLMPVGQFGTRAQGGKDSASTRYIFTNVNEQTRTLFPEDDTAVLNYLCEEGMSIEPSYYVPIIPLVLANGAEGIGTGWSTSIPQFSPLDLIENLRAKLKTNRAFKRMTPWYRGFTGQVDYISETNSYLFHGAYTCKYSSNRLEISELPIKKWTSDFKKFLEDLMQKDEIEDIREHHQDNAIKFVLTVPNLRELEQSEGGIKKKFKLTYSISANNMVLFDSEYRIKRYNDECQILSEFFPIRLNLYNKRKQHQLGVMRRDLCLMDNKCRFIEGLNSGEIVLRDKSKAQIVQSLEAMQFAKDCEISAASLSSKNDEKTAVSFDYLLNMPLYSLTKEKIDDLRSKIRAKKDDIEKLERATIEDLWLSDLDKFEQIYRKDLEQRGFSANSNFSRTQPPPQVDIEHRIKVPQQTHQTTSGASNQPNGQTNDKKRTNSSIVHQSPPQKNSHQSTKAKKSSEKTTAGKKRLRPQVKPNRTGGSSESSSSEFSSESESDQEKIVKRTSNSRAYAIEAPKYDPYAKKAKVSPSDNSSSIRKVVQINSEGPNKDDQLMLDQGQVMSESNQKQGIIANSREVKYTDKAEKGTISYFFTSANVKTDQTTAGDSSNVTKNAVEQDAKSAAAGESNCLKGDRHIVNETNDEDGGKILSFRERLGLLNQKSPPFNLAPASNNKSDDIDLQKEIADLMIKNSDNGPQQNNSSTTPACPQNSSPSAKENKNNAYSNIFDYLSTKKKDENDEEPNYDLSIDNEDNDIRRPRRSKNQKRKLEDDEDEFN